MTRTLLTSTTIALFMAAAPLGFSGAALAKGAVHTHAASHAAAGGHHGGSGGSSKGGNAFARGGKSGGGKSGNDPLDTARSIFGMVGGILGSR